MATPRAVKDSDTALWLHNKLGSTEELWLSSSIGGIIKTDTIDNIYRCFSVLTTTVKMKLLLGILHLTRRNLDEMKGTIELLVEMALDDVDQWVRSIANVVKTYPMRGRLNLDLKSNQSAASIVEQLREKVNDSDVFSTLPLECQYVNKNALQSLVGNQPPPVRHFALKRKPKSAALRVDLMQRSNDASNQVKKDGSGFSKTVPVKHRDMTRKLSDASPMRGIPKTPSGGHRSEGFRTQSTPSSHLTPGAASRTASRFGSRAERGTKLLDISEQPLGIREQKRRKKQQQEGEASQATAEEKMDETPEYAAGLPQTIGQPVVPEDDHPGPSSTNAELEKQDEEEEEEEDDDQDVQMDDEEYQSHYNSPPASPSKDYSSIEEEEHPSISAPPQSEIASPQKLTAVEKRRSVDELPVYAIPATPSPYFKPVTAPRMVVPSPAHPKAVASVPHTLPFHTSPSASSSSPSPVRNPAPSPASPLIRPSSVITPNRNVQHKVVVSHLQSVQSNVPKPQEIPQIPRFYTTTIQSQPARNAAQPSSTISHQASVGSPAAVIHTLPGALYRPQVSHGVRPGGVPYMVSPNLVQLQQLRPQNVRFAPTANLIGSSAAAQSQIFRHQLQQVQLQQQAAQQAAAAQQAQQQQAQKKNWSLTHEQMIEAQEMFKTANRLSRQEKAIILGFMAGSRENPTPDGDIVQITLSEHEQVLQNPTDRRPIPVVVETYYEMNYRTGVSEKKQRLKQYVAQYKS